MAPRFRTSKQAQSPRPFVTSDLKAAGFALAAGGRLAKLHDEDPHDVRFEIEGVDPDFDQQMHAGHVQVDAGLAWMTLERIHKLVLAAKRRAPR